MPGPAGANVVVIVVDSQQLEEVPAFVFENVVPSHMKRTALFATGTNLAYCCQ